MTKREPHLFVEDDIEVQQYTLKDRLKTLKHLKELINIEICCTQSEINVLNGKKQ